MDSGTQEVRPGSSAASQWSGCAPPALDQIGSMGSTWHQVTWRALDALTEDLQALTAAAEEGEDGRRAVWKAADDHAAVCARVEAMVTSLEAGCAARGAELQTLTGEADALLAERDALIEKGHELNCRIGYNSLEKKLEEAFIAQERYTTVASARCFRDEAEENLKRTNDLIRVGNMRACQIDRDLYNEMEKITDVFENYEKERDLYVKELDHFCDVRRRRISLWLAESRTDEERKLGEDILDFLSLSEKQRHMEPQVVKNALRMYSFNATLTFDREDNLKLLDELTSVQAKVNMAAGEHVVLPRPARAVTDLTRGVQDDEGSGVAEADRSDEGASTEERAESPRVTSSPVSNGRSLHRCPRQLALNTDPITDPELVRRLDAELRWVDPDAEAVYADSEPRSDVSLSDVTPSLRPDGTVVEKKELAPVHGDTMKGRTVEFDINNETGHAQHGGEELHMVATGESTFLHHMESSPVLPSLLCNQDKSSLFGVLRKRKSSLTNVSKTNTSSSGHHITGADTQEGLVRDSQERVCRGSDCTLKTRPRDDQAK